MYYNDHPSITGEEFGCKLRCCLFYGRMTICTMITVDKFEIACDANGHKGPLLTTLYTNYGSYVPTPLRARKYFFQRNGNFILDLNR